MATVESMVGPRPLGEARGGADPSELLPPGVPGRSRQPSNVAVAEERERAVKVAEPAAEAEAATRRHQRLALAVADERAGSACEKRRRGAILAAGMGSNGLV